MDTPRSQSTDIIDKRKTLQYILGARKTKTWKCALVNCTSSVLEIVDVPARAGVDDRSISQPADLDVFLWVPLSNSHCTPFVDLNANHVTVEGVILSSSSHLKYSFTFYYCDQHVVRDDFTPGAENYFVADLTGGAIAPWYGDILVIKWVPGRAIAAVHKDDLGIIQTILKRHLIEGRVGAM